MLKLHLPLNDDIEINGKQYKINASFDTILRVIKLANNNAINITTKTKRCLFELINDELEHVSDKGRVTAISAILKRYMEQKESKPILRDITGEEIVLKEDEPKKLIDFDVDAERIYSSFIQAYGIDLIDMQGKLHWHKFKALLNGLPEDTALMQVIRIRQYDPNEENLDQKIRRTQLRDKYSLD